MREYRCQLPASSYKLGICGGILFRVDVRTEGRIEVKCHRCKRVQTVEVRQYHLAYST